MAMAKKTRTGRVLHDPIRDKLVPTDPLDLRKIRTIDDLVRAMGRTAFTARQVGDAADVVVIGLDRGLTYDKLDHAARVVRAGAAMVATHVARVYMYKDGPALATGPVVKALEYATGSRATVVGKPSPLMFRIALKKARCPPRRAVMVGDQIDTDILGAKRAGIDSILVLTGVDREVEGSGAMCSVSNVDELSDAV